MEQPWKQRAGLQALWHIVIDPWPGICMMCMPLCTYHYQGNLSLKWLVEKKIVVFLGCYSTMSLMTFVWFLCFLAVLSDTFHTLTRNLNLRVDFVKVNYKQTSQLLARGLKKKTHLVLSFQVGFFFFISYLMKLIYCKVKWYCQFVKNAMLHLLDVQTLCLFVYCPVILILCKCFHNATLAMKLFVLSPHPIIQFSD